ncbi:MAG: HAD-IB family phosphatase [Ruminococcus sp.]|nr:HAD-IB family phosphatase [Ruminococcus sp.]
MNVYDFDNTIYKGDSTRDFYLFCLKKHKKILLLLPSLGLEALKYYVFKIGNKTEFKEKMYAFLKFCDTQIDIKEFWDSHLCNIKEWYLKQKNADDVIISASPQFLLKPLEEKLNITVIASDVDSKSGKYNGINCYYDEKVRRFFEIYPNGHIEYFYSDHYSDEPLAKIADKAFIVDGDNILEWDHSKHIKPNL